MTEQAGSSCLPYHVGKEVGSDGPPNVPRHRHEDAVPSHACGELACGVLLGQLGGDGAS